jgi:phosphotransferase system HPr (HPr) family protein
MGDPAADPARARAGEPPREPLLDDGPAAGALDRVLREGEYRERLAREAHDLFRLEALLRRGVQGEVSRRFCLRLAEEAERIESGLMEVGARGNRTYACFAELVTKVRRLSQAVHALLHLRGRIRRYLGDRADLESFRSSLRECVRWLVGRLAALLAEIRAQAEGPLALSPPAEPFDAGLLKGEDVRLRLPQDLDVPESVDERERIADLATTFLGLVGELAGVEVHRAESGAQTTTMSPSAAHEARVRMHAIQSGYDAAVAATPLEASDPTLKVFRGYVSILLHLLEAVAYLLMILERLRTDVRSARVKERIEPLLPAAELEKWAVGFAVANTVLCAAESRAAGQAVLDRYTRRADAVLELPPGRKLHLRPSGLIVRVVQHHGLPVTMCMEGQEVDARQLMDVILLAASHPQATSVGFRGDERVLEDLRTLFAHRLGEDGLDGLPASLQYLRDASRPASA